MGFFQLRRARLRGLIEGLVQRARVEATEADAKDDAERFQDYGYASNPGDGQGLVLHVGGHTIVLRMDRLAERPHLAPYEVCIWHKEGHSVTLKAGKVVQVDCNKLVVNAAEEVDFITPSMKHNGVNVGGDHKHGGVTIGDQTTGTPM
jgi:phage gp45-like